MSEQKIWKNKMIADGLRMRAWGIEQHDKELEGTAAKLREYADMLDPKPEHPSNGEIVEVVLKTSGSTALFYAGKNGVYAFKGSKYPCANWSNIESWRILPDPDKCIMIEKPKDLPEWVDHIEVRFKETDKPSWLWKTITREEMERGNR